MFADFRGFLQMFAKKMQNLANFGICFGLIFRARWAIFRMLTQNIEKLNPGAVFAPRECFFQIPRVFLINLAEFLSIFEQSGPFSAGFSVF